MKLARFCVGSFAMLAIAAGSTGCSDHSSAIHQTAAGSAEDHAMIADVDTFDPSTPPPSGIVSGRFLMVGHCLAFETGHDAHRYRPILPPTSRIATNAAGRPDAVMVGGDRVELGAVVSVGGGVAPWSGKPAATGCPTDTIIIGGIVKGGSS